MHPFVLCGCRRYKVRSSCLHSKCSCTLSHLSQTHGRFCWSYVWWGDCLPKQLYLPPYFQTQGLQQSLVGKKSKQNNNKNILSLYIPENLFIACSPSIVLCCFPIKWTVICNRSHVCIIHFTALFFATYKVCVLSNPLHDKDCLKEDVLQVKICCNVIMFSYLDKYMARILKLIF